MLLRYAILLCWLPIAASATSIGVCVTNGTSEPLLFVAEAKGAAQVLSDLRPDQTLCSGPGARPGGVVRVFTDATAIEGCSRLVPDGVTETLVEYRDFDRCHWSSHDK